MLKKLTIGLLLAASFSASAFANPVTQTTAPASSYNSNWSNSQLGTVSLATGTNAILDLSSTVTIQDQGWGGEDPSGNQVVLGLFDNGTELWGMHVAGGYHDLETQTYSASASDLTNLDTILASINWSSDPTVTLQLYTSTIGYPGWSLTTQNASFSVTSEAVPEPAPMALLGLGLVALAVTRKKMLK